MQSNIECKIATLADKENIHKMVEANCTNLPEGTCTPDNFKTVADYVLSDIDWGFFILAEDTASKEPLGIMYFTYEWSDWRNGVFFWL